MMRALYSSVAGLRTHQTKMDVIGNNIANVNTVGFKSSRTTFSTMMYQTTSFASGANAATGRGGINAKQIGLGTTFASTAVDIDTGGASETTGKAFDLKLSDSNSTSFYIVNNGTENVFTRAGAFSVDGAGNLCMESTGYTVMGWQVDANGNIRKDTVTPLKIMSAGNQTSQPEYTTSAVCTGILDDNNSNVNSDEGYNMNLNFFDNLGYPYTARFSMQKTGGEDADGIYTINLTDIQDANGKSIFTAKSKGLGDIFGGGQGSNVYITKNYKVTNGMGNTLTKLANDTADATTGQMTYNFTSDQVNQWFGPASKTDRLPSGLRVELKVTPDANGGAPTTELKVYDSNNTEFDISTYTWINDATATVPGGGTGTAGPENQAWKTTTFEEKLQNMVDTGVIKPTTRDDGNGGQETVYILESKAVRELYDEFKKPMADAGNALPDYISGDMEFVLTADKKVDLTSLKWADGAGGGDTAFPGALGAATYTDVLSNHIEEGYVVVPTDKVNEMGVFTTDIPSDAEIRYTYGKNGAWSYEIVTPGSDGYELQFSTADGSLTYIGSTGKMTQTLRLSELATEGNPFSDIEIDFSTLKNLANGASNTAAMSPGDGDGEGKGKKVGTLIGLSVDNAGKIYGSYSNGNTTLLGQIAVARFANASGLESIGDNCYRTTMNSGEFDGIGVEMDSDGSSIDSGTLEMSNVDLATEFTTMITTQRGYQANSRVISTSDSILEELVNLKR